MENANHLSAQALRWFFPAYRQAGIPRILEKLITDSPRGSNTESVEYYADDTVHTKHHEHANEPVDDLPFTQLSRLPLTRRTNKLKEAEEEDEHRDSKEKENDWVNDESINLV